MIQFSTRHFLKLVLTAFSMFILCSCSPEKAKTSGEIGTSHGGPLSATQSADRTTEGNSADNSSTPCLVTDEGSTISRPVLRKACIIPENKDNCDILRAVAEGRDSKGKPLSFKYEWRKNNFYAGDSDSLSDFKKGDKISVEITPFDGKNYGPSRILTTEIKKSTPKLTESNQVSFDGKVLVYQVRAVDPDGYPINYSLMDAPQGMDIDKNSGLIKWVLPGNISGDQSVKVKISDNTGGEVVYTLNIAMGKK